MPKFVIEVDTDENTVSVTKNGEAFTVDSSEMTICVNKYINCEGEHDCGISIEEYEKKDGMRRMVRSTAEKADRDSLSDVLKKYMK